MPNPERLLLPGMFVREEIQEGVRQGAVLAPQQGISHDQKGEPNALVVGPNNTVELRTIVTDRAIGDQWLVTSGLKPGDRIIVEGIQLARPGSQVVPEEYRPAGEKTAQPPPAAALGAAK
jgi:membrane fusion protein (multidrug efflux system)